MLIMFPHAFLNDLEKLRYKHTFDNRLQTIRHFLVLYAPKVK